MKQTLCVILAVCLLCGCAGGESQPEEVGGSTRRKAVQSEEVQFVWPDAAQPTAQIATSKGDITVVLYPQHAPMAVENFCRLAAQGYYDSTVFHRVVRDFIVQAGDVTGTGLSGQTVWGGALGAEPSDALHHYSGALCLAPGAGDGGMASQFYILATPQNGLDEAALQKLRDAGMREAVVETYRQAGGAPYLDYTDTVFGQVIDGMDVVDEIARAATDDEGRPKVDIEIYGIALSNWPQGQTGGDGVPQQDLPAAGADAGSSTQGQDSLPG